MDAAVKIVMSRQEAVQIAHDAKLALESSAQHFGEGQRYYDAARQLLWQLKEYRGWEAMGFSSWGACTAKMFPNTSKTVLYNRLAAAAVENAINPHMPMGEIKERVLRPLVKYSEETQRMLWELAVSVVGSPNSVTSGTIKAVIETLSGILQTGYIENEQGEQYSLFQQVSESILAQTVESMKRQQEYINSGHKKGLKVLTAMPVGHIRLINDKSMQIDVEDQFTAEQLKNIDEFGTHLRVSIWVDLPEGEGQ